MKTKKIITLILCLSLLITPTYIKAKAATSGFDYNGNKWTYDATTKTLTFSGTKDISDFVLNGHDPEPSWYKWNKKTEYIVIEEGITGIGESAFCDFVYVKKITLPISAKQIKYSAFQYNYRLKEIIIPDKVTVIGDCAFAGCSGLKSLPLPSGLKRMGCLEFCKKLKSIIFPNTVKKLEKGILTGCESLTSVQLPSGLKEIKAYDFFKCKMLKKLDIPITVKSIAMSAFAGSGLKKIVLPQHVTTIKNGTFGKRAPFKYLYGIGAPTKNLRVIEIHSKKVKNIQKNSFSGLSSKVVIKVPKSRKKKYTKMLRKSGLSKKVKIKVL